MSATTTCLTETITKTESKDKDGVRPWSIDKDGLQKLPNGAVINWKRGMVGQAHKAGECYPEWIEHPKMGRLRMFDNNLLEATTFTSWWMVPILYIPWGILEARECSFIYSNTQTFFIFIMGIFVWTVFEYVAHRWAFHWEPKHSSLNWFHFMSHGLHHLTPADPYRLVFPPAVSMPLALSIRWIIYLLPLGINAGITGGFMCGYAWYESTHYLSHHNPVGSYLQERFKKHSMHHFNPDKRDKIFGVTQNWFDVLFGTL